MDRRIVLFLLVAALAVVFGFFALTPDQSLQAVIYGGYWAMLLLTILFGWTLYKVARDSRLAWSDLAARPKWPAALVLACGLLLLAHEAYGFKILMDEVMLLGTSMSLHLDKTALVPMRGHDIQGAFQLLAGQIDKRPLFHPFLLSVLHDLTGYRPENAFVLNTVLTFVFLALAYITGFRIAGRAAGAVTVLLLTSLPLLAQNATGGGFELLNLVMILATLLLAMRYVERRDANSLEAFGLSAILLANTRYESVVYLLPVGLIVLWVWWSERRPLLTWLVICLPLFLLPYALHNKVFSVRSSSWEMASQPGYDKPFSVSYIADNIAHDLNFFFNTNGEHSNSLVISIFAVLGVPLFALWAMKTLLRLRSAPPVRAALALFSIGFLAHAVLLLCYFWGRFDDPVIRRLSLPMNLAMVVATVTAAAEMSGGGRVWRVLAVLTGIGFFAHSLPSMARHGYSAEYYVGREMDWRREFIAAHPEKDYLFVDNNSIIWITHLVSATPVRQAIEQKGKLLFNFQNHIFSKIYVFQRLTVDPATGRTAVPLEDDLGPDYQLEKVWERRFTPMTVSRISRVVSIREGPVVKPVAPPASADKLTPAELEKARAAFFEEFVKKLP
jgi:hypothetical protein